MNYQRGPCPYCGSYDAEEYDSLSGDEFVYECSECNYYFTVDPYTGMTEEYGH